MGHKQEWASVTASSGSGSAGCSHVQEMAERLLEEAGERDLVVERVDESMYPPGSNCLPPDV